MESYSHIDEWVKYLVDSAEIPRVVLVANKIDLPHQVGEQMYLDKAESLGYQLYLTSAKTGQGIEELYAAIGEYVLQNENDKSSAASTGVALAAPSSQPRQRDCSC
jgi:GTPase SAR1 family protein